MYREQDRRYGSTKPLAFGNASGEQGWQTDDTLNHQCQAMAACGYYPANGEMLPIFRGTLDSDEERRKDCFDKAIASLQRAILITKTQKYERLRPVIIEEIVQTSDDGTYLRRFVLVMMDPQTKMPTPIPELREVAIQNLTAITDLIMDGAEILARSLGNQKTSNFTFGEMLSEGQKLSEGEKRNRL